MPDPDDAPAHFRRNVHFEMLGPETHDPRTVLPEAVNDFRHVCGSSGTATVAARWK